MTLILSTILFISSIWRHGFLLSANDSVYVKDKDADSMCGSTPPPARAAVVALIPIDVRT